MDSFGTVSRSIGYEVRPHSACTIRRSRQCLGSAWPKGSRQIEQKEIRIHNRYIYIYIYIFIYMHIYIVCNTIQIRYNTIQLDTLCIYIWANYNDLTATSLESWLIRGMIPKWPYFRLLYYYYHNLPRCMHIYIYICNTIHRKYNTNQIQYNTA